MVVGSNTTEGHPISALHIKQACRRGAKLIVIDPRKIPLANSADLFLQIKPGANAALFNSMLQVIIEQNLADSEFINSRTEGWDNAVSTALSQSLETAEHITNVPAELISQAAKLYAGSSRAIIVGGLGVDEHEYGTDSLLCLVNLALATGNIGRPGTGVFVLRGQNNVQGACDMGCLPNVLPGYQSVKDPFIRKNFSERWGNDIPDWPGKNSVQMMDSAIEGSIKALYIWGEDPAQTHGNSKNIHQALGALDFLVYQDIFFTKTAAFADVVLPASSFAEKTGTFTNTERRVRLLRQAVEPVGSSRPDWQIFNKLSKLLGLGSSFKNTSEIYDEISGLCYYFRGISHKRLGANGLQWPCINQTHPGTERLYTNSFPSGTAKFSAIPYKEPTEHVDDEYPLILITGRRLAHFNNSAQTRRSDAADRTFESLDMHPEDMSRHGLVDRQLVEVSSRRATITMRLAAEEMMKPGTLFAAFHDPDTPVNMLIGGPRDTNTDTYSYKYCAVRVTSQI